MCSLMNDTSWCKVLPASYSSRSTNGTCKTRDHQDCFQTELTLCSVRALQSLPAECSQLISPVALTPRAVDGRPSVIYPPSAKHPIACARTGVLDGVGLVDSTTLAALPVPWPRWQEAASQLRIASADDVVVAVSHAWEYREHPDPFGETTDYVRAGLHDAYLSQQTLGNTMCFYDFLSIPQNPAQAGQSERSAVEEALFRSAMKATPWIFLLSDCIVHIDIPRPETRSRMLRMSDTSHYEVACEELLELELKTVLAGVQVRRVPKGGFLKKRCNVELFDFVISVDSKAVKDAEEVLQSVRSGARHAVMLRCPYGGPHRVANFERGWIYLERFFTMVKIALNDAGAINRLVFSNNPDLLHELEEGSEKLRCAANMGEESLREVMRGFADELSKRVFSADEVTPPQELESSYFSFFQESKEDTSDKATALEILADFIETLPKEWQRESKSQRQRQLVLAVKRSDVALVHSLLNSTMDPNVPDELGRTVLHLAAEYRQPMVIKVLLYHGADLLARDGRGNCPASVFPLCPDELTLTLFDILAPWKEILMATNSSGVSPLQRFASWARTARDGGPHPPALRCLKRIEAGGIVSDFTQGVKNLRHYEVNVISSDAQKFTSHVWECPDGSDYDILYLGLNPFVPWVMQKVAVSELASALCLMHHIKFIAISHDAISATKSMTLPRYQRSVSQAIKALKMRDNSILIDDTLGAATSLLWDATERFKGFIVLNFSAFWDFDFIGTEEHEHVCEGFSRLGLLFEAVAREHSRTELGTARTLGGVLTTMGAYAEEINKVSSIQAAYEAALLDSSLDYFKLGASQIRGWCFRALSDDMEKRPPLKRDAPPVLFLVGTFAFPQFTVAATEKLCCEKVQNSTIDHIPSGAVCWQVEGPAPVAFVTSTASAFLRSIDRAAGDDRQRLSLSGGSSRLSRSTSIDGYLLMGQTTTRSTPKLW